MYPAAEQSGASQRCGCAGCGVARRGRDVGGRPVASTATCERTLSIIPRAFATLYAVVTVHPYSPVWLDHMHHSPHRRGSRPRYAVRSPQATRENSEGHQRKRRKAIHRNRLRTRDQVPRGGIVSPRHALPCAREHWWPTPGHARPHGAGSTFSAQGVSILGEGRECGFSWRLRRLARALCPSTP